MKPINFIQAISTPKQQSLKTWICFSLLVGIVTCIIIGWFQVQQLRSFFTLKAKYLTLAHYAIEHTTFNTRKDTVSKTKQELEAQTRDFKHYQEDPATPLVVMNAIMEACKNRLPKSLTIEKQSVEIALVCATAQEAFTIAEQLEKSAVLKNVALVSLTPYNNSKEINCLITATPVQPIEHAQQKTA